MSALDLSSRAGLSMNYVRNIERGLRSLGLAAAEKLATVLELDPSERAALLGATTPPAVLEALSSPIPGLVTWKYLPRLLWASPHNQVAPLYTGLDHAVTDLVRSAAPLLAWAWLCKSPPDKKQARRLSTLAEDAITAAIPTIPRVTAGVTGRPSREFAAMLTLPRLWIEMLFGSRRSAEAVVKLLDRWEYHPCSSPGQPDTLSFHFEDAQLQQIWGVAAIAADEIAGLHCTLLLSDLFAIVADAGLNLGSPTATTWRGADRSGKLLKWVAGLTEDKLRRKLAAAESDSLVLDRYARRLDRARFSRRIFERPYAAGMILGREAARSLKDPVDAGIAMLDRAVQAARSGA